MSHVVEIRTQVRDPIAVSAACLRLELEPPVQGSFKLFSQTVSGLAVRLPEWRYPVVFDCATGESRFDNYEGRWGPRQQLDRFLQVYATEKVKLEARKQGRSVTEQQLADGSIRLTVGSGGVS